ncbi:MAG: IclR family transcriptional regulator [Candidatus Methylomirabilales bacterium]
MGTDGSIQSLRKGLELLFLFSEAEPHLSLTQISARLKLPKSTAYRFIATLKEGGLLTQDPETRLYRLGARLLALPAAVVHPTDLRTLALPFLRQLVEQSGETAHLTERRGAAGVIAEVVESPHVLRMAPRRGQTFALHAGALGRAILAFLPPHEAEPILRRRALPRFTPNTPATPAALRRRLEETRQAGYAVSLAEVTAGACGISAPILGPEGWAVASLGISGPLERLDAEKRAGLIEPVREAARALSTLVKRQFAAAAFTPASARSARRS